MAGKKIAELLLNSQTYVHSNKRFRDASRTCITSAKLTVLNKLGNLELIIPKNSNEKSDIVQINILNSKIKEAKANQKGLSGKMKHLDNSIESLGNMLNLQQKVKKKKIWNKEIEDIKTEEVQKNIKKLVQEQHERQKVLEQREKEKIEKIEMEEKIRKEELEKIEGKKNEEKLKRLQESKEKTEERKKYIEGLKEIKPVKKKKLLHEKFAEEFEKNVVIPETERIAEALSVRHKVPVPSFDELQSHIKEYRKLMQSKSFSKHSVSYSESRRFSPSKFLQVINDEEQLAKEMDKIREAEKLDLIDRKKNYAKLVRQLYQPSELKNEKKVRPIPAKRRVYSVTPTLKKSERLQYKAKGPVKLVKPKELPKIDYLGQRREQREKEEKDVYSYSVDFNSVNTAKKFEERTKQLEIAVKHSSVSDYNIDAEEKLNKLLIDNIKTKLEALNKLS